MSKVLLRVSDLHAFYGESHILHGVNLEIREGELVTLLGRNGAGRSTTLKAILGLTGKRSGSIVVDGVETIKMQTNRIARLGLGYCPEERGIFSTLSCEENLMLPPTVGEGGMSVDEIYEMFPNLKERRQSQGTRLSGGEQQMLAIGRALMTQPRLLMLDEPSLGLAPFLVAEIFDIVRRINKEEGLSVLLVEQNAIAALEVVSHGYLIENGRIVMHDTAEAMKKNPDIQEFYLGGAEGRDFRDIKHYRRRKRWLS